MFVFNTLFDMKTEREKAKKVNKAKITLKQFCSNQVIAINKKCRNTINTPLVAQPEGATCTPKSRLLSSRYNNEISKLFIQSVILREVYRHKCRFATPETNFWLRHCSPLPTRALKF